MKKLLLLSFAFFILFFAGCNKDDNNPVSPNDDGTVTELKGKINDWSLGSSMTVYMGSYGLSHVDKDGNFNINIYIPSTDDLYPIKNHFSGYSQKPEISDTLVKCCFVNFLKIESSNNTGNPSAIVAYCSSDSAVSYSIPGEYRTYYWYVNKDVTINGTWKVPYSYNIYSDLIFEDLTFKKGWNKFIWYFDTYDTHNNTYKIKILRKEPAAGGWYYLMPANKR